MPAYIVHTRARAYTHTHVRAHKTTLNLLNPRINLPFVSNNYFKFFIIIKSNFWGEIKVDNLMSFWRTFHMTFLSDLSESVRLKRTSWKIHIRNPKVFFLKRLPQLKVMTNLDKKSLLILRSNFRLNKIYFFYLPLILVKILCKNCTIKITG